MIQGNLAVAPLGIAPRHVVAPLQHVPFGAPPPVVYNPPEGQSQRTGEFVNQPVVIADARQLGATLDVHGFELRDAPTQVSDFTDEAEVKSRYYQEVNDLVIAATGATRVEIFDATVRIQREDTSSGSRAPVPVAHNDYTEKSAPQRVRDLLGDMADTLLGRRYAFINVWRSIRGPVMAWPLGMVDARTVVPSDMVPTDLVYPDRTGEIYHLHPSEDHRWYYYPRMLEDEALLLKCFDSATDGVARYSPHGAFDDPTTPEDAPPRQSIEVRTIAFFD